MMSACVSRISSFQLLEFVSESVYVDLQYDEISLTFACVCAARVTEMLAWGPGEVCLR